MMKDWSQWKELGVRSSDRRTARPAGSALRARLIALPLPLPLPLHPYLEPVERAVRLCHDVPYVRVAG